MSLRRHGKKIKRHYKHLAAAVAGAALMSTAILSPISPVKAAPASQAAPDKPPSETPESPKSHTPQEYEKVLDIKATAYYPGPECNDQWGDKTFLGTKIRPGIIAVDPRIIPLGSKVYIKYPDGTGVYAVAEDTGGAIKGNRIDVAKWTADEANEFGIKHVKVYVINSPKGKKV